MACSPLPSNRLPHTGMAIPSSSRLEKPLAGSPGRGRKDVSRRANTAMSRQETASLTVLPMSTAPQAYPAPQAASRDRAKAATAMRTSCSMSWAVMLGSTRLRARKHPRSAPATAMKGRLGASARSPSSARASWSIQWATGSARANCASMARVPKQAAALTSPHKVGAIPRPLARLWAASLVDATFTPAVASETNTPYTARISWYRPMPSPPSQPAIYTRNTMPSTRMAKPAAVSSAAFFR